MANSLPYVSKMTIFLHIGAHKTGTTTIQKAARKNEAVLAEKGCLYPAYSLIGKPGHYAHHHIAHGLAGIPKNRIGAKGAKLFLQEVVKQTKNYNCALISAEPMYRHYGNNNLASRNPITYWQERENYISKVKSCFADADVQVVLTVRSQANFALSLYQENVKVRRYSPEFPAFLEEYWYYFEYLKQIELWEKFFGRVKLLIFEDLVKDGNLVSNFFEALNQIDTKSFITPEKTNESLCPDFLEFKRQMNRTSFSRINLNSLRQFLVKNSQAWIKERKITTKEIVADSSTLNEFQSRFEHENKILANKYFDDRETLFPEYIYLKESEYKGLQTEHAFQIFARYANSLID